MKHVMAGILSAGILFMLLVTSLPVKAEAEYSKECIAAYIPHGGGQPPTDLWEYDSIDLYTKQPPLDTLWPFWTEDDGIVAVLNITWGNDNSNCPPLKFEYSIETIKGGPFSEYSIYVNSSLETEGEGFSDTIICPYGHTASINASVSVWEGVSMDDFRVWVNCTIYQWDPQEEDWGDPWVPQEKYFWWAYPLW
jgi:hypothetical protein